MSQRHPVFARLYTRLRPSMDEAGAAEHRRLLLAGLRGEVVEVGAGDGGNFRHYPVEVTRVLALEPEPYLRARAQTAPATAPVELVDAGADRLPVGDGSVDAVVFSLVLCSVPDQSMALAEARRVLRPGGELRFYEHVAGSGRQATFQRVADASFWPLLAGGCHSYRDTAGAIAAAGFTIEELEAFDFPPGGISPARPHVRGRATPAQ